MGSIGAFEARTRLAELLRRAAAGEEITITRRGKAVARLVPAAPPQGDPIADVIAEMRRIRARSSLAGLSWRALRDEGRP